MLKISASVNESANINVLTFSEGHRSLNLKISLIDLFNGMFDENETIFADAEYYVYPPYSDDVVVPKCKSDFVVYLSYENQKDRIVGIQIQYEGEHCAGVSLGVDLYAKLVSRVNEGQVFETEGDFEAEALDSIFK